MCGERGGGEGEGKEGDIRTCKDMGEAGRRWPQLVIFIRRLFLVTKRIHALVLPFDSRQPLKISKAAVSQLLGFKSIPMPKLG